MSFNRQAITLIPVAFVPERNYKKVSTSDEANLRISSLTFPQLFSNSLFLHTEMTRNQQKLNKHHHHPPKKNHRPFFAGFLKSAYFSVLAWTIIPAE